MLHLIPIDTLEQAKEVKAAAAADNHSVLSPNYCAMKDGKIVGAVSAGNIPAVILWADSQAMRPRDCFMLFKETEKLLRLQGYDLALFPARPESPFTKFADKFGYPCVWKSADLHLATLNS